MSYQTYNFVLTFHLWVQVAKWATSFSFLVAHRQHLVALASGRPVICNPALRCTASFISCFFVCFDALPCLIFHIFACFCLSGTYSARRSVVSTCIRALMCTDLSAVIRQKSHVLENFSISFKVLSNTDHVTSIPFGHFAIVLTSWYRQNSYFCREDFRRAIMTSWETRRNLAYALQNLQFFHHFTMKFNIFSLNLTGDSDFLILFISMQYKLSMSGFS